MSGSTDVEGMISIWHLVGLILTLYGAIITGCGLYYAMTGVPQTVAGSSNPSLWWGIIILVSGIIFIVAGKNKKKA